MARNIPKNPVSSILGVFFCPEDRGRKFPRNVGHELLPDYMTSDLRRSDPSVSLMSVEMPLVYASGFQLVCRGSLREGRKEARKKWGIKKQLRFCTFSIQGQ
jgi:hypothetical protein